MNNLTIVALPLLLYYEKLVGETEKVKKLCVQLWKMIGWFDRPLLKQPQLLPVWDRSGSTRLSEDAPAHTLSRNAFHYSVEFVRVQLPRSLSSFPP